MREEARFGGGGVFAGVGGGVAVANNFAGFEGYSGGGFAEGCGHAGKCSGGLPFVEVFYVVHFRGVVGEGSFVTG